MYEEMLVRNYSPRTISTYISLVSAVSKHFGKIPEQISIGKLRNTFSIRSKSTKCPLQG
ncbi:hypothetical protein QWY93_19275 [Echinicola jeungdonensis]|uniref:hypothetical protein n=1 Tax=Echinicola jeungdonensis TaxID=709343 RepID=UPI0025B38925|nr:hypothetical protein [Echinicola jeungdonensis]MDN3671401.1 hypothetical protein [Echinicola jeungdonensis]